MGVTAANRPLDPHARVGLVMCGQRGSVRDRPQQVTCGQRGSVRERPQQVRDRPQRGLTPTPTDSRKGTRYYARADPILFAVKLRTEGRQFGEPDTHAVQTAHFQLGTCAGWWWLFRNRVGRRTGLLEACYRRVPHGSGHHRPGGQAALRPRSPRCASRKDCPGRWVDGDTAGEFPQGVDSHEQATRVEHFVLVFPEPAADHLLEVHHVQPCTGLQ